VTRPHEVVCLGRRVGSWMVFTRQQNPASVFICAVWAVIPLLVLFVSLSTERGRARGGRRDRRGDRRIEEAGRAFGTGGLGTSPVRRPPVSRWFVLLDNMVAVCLCSFYLELLIAYGVVSFWASRSARVCGDFILGVIFLLLWGVRQTMRVFFGWFPPSIMVSRMK
jgi:hypothetical protein